MPRGWPPLSLTELKAVLAALEFHYTKSSGGHDFYVGFRNGRKYKVTVDPKNAPFSSDLMRSMCHQAGCTREEFYGATHRAKAKIA